ncbi:MAG: GxxExxY protein [Pirellulales bacterium]
MLESPKLQENPLSKEIVDAAYEIHTKLGPGLLESVYEVILAAELKSHGLRIERQVPVPIVWKNIQFIEGYRLDLMVEDKVLVKVKAVEAIEPVHKMQLLTYLRLMDKRLGLLINFNEELIRNGISRVVNGLQD